MAGRISRLSNLANPLPPFFRRSAAIAAPRSFRYNRRGGATAAAYF